MKVQQSTRISISNIRMLISGTSRTISVSNNRTKVEQGHKYKGNTIYGYKHISILGDYNQILTLPHDWISPYGSIPIILLNFSTLTLAIALVNRSAGMSSVDTNIGLIISN